MWGWLRELHEVLQEAADRRSRCASCEMLQIELAQRRRENQILLDRIVNPTPDTFQTLAPEPQPLHMKHKPWRVKQQELEAKDKAEHERIMTEFRERTAAVEKTIGVANGEV